jgi:AraC-like DNA-binding protein
MVTAITKDSGLPVTLFSSTSNETTFEVCFSLKPSVNKPVALNGNAINYTSVVKGIQTHFAKLNDPVARLADTKPKEAVFLTNINKCILENIDDERFDANALSNTMAMSRAQLLRRLKSLTGNSPGFHIKTMRLEKAKELLETSDLSVSEAAFKTGFGTLSNFSKVFSEKYGMTPSQFRQINPNATNK